MSARLGVAAPDLSGPPAPEDSVGIPLGVTPRRTGRLRRGGILLVAAGLAAASATLGGASPALRGPEGNGPLLLVVAGVGGTPEHRERFSAWARDLCAAAISAPGPRRVLVLLEREGEPADEADPCAPGGRSTLEEIGRRIAEAGGAPGAAEGLFVVLIGHGSGGANTGGREARFNLPGPDLTPAELARMLDAVSAGPVTVAHLGSASGAFVPALSAPGRVILAASAAHETNETRFAEHFIAAFSNDDSGGGADRNKDGRLSALEAFDFARLGVEREYDERGLLRTEHPLLDDNGDGVGSLDPATAPGSDGVLAARRSLLFRTAEAAGEAAPEGADPELRALIAERDELAARVDALREVRESMDEEAYLAELETLLLRIAEIAERIAAIRARTEEAR